MPKSVAEDLAEFAQAHRRTGGVACRTCTLPQPLRSALEDGRANGIAYRVLGMWLKTKGVSLADTTIQRHFSMGHVK